MSVKTNGSSQLCIDFAMGAGRWSGIRRRLGYRQRLHKTQTLTLTRHTWEFTEGEGARFYQKQNKQPECFLNQSWPFWPLFSSLHLAI